MILKKNDHNPVKSIKNLKRWGIFCKGYPNVINYKSFQVCHSFLFTHLFNLLCFCTQLLISTVTLKPILCSFCEKWNYLRLC